MVKLWIGGTEFENEKSLNRRINATI